MNDIDIFRENKYIITKSFNFFKVKYLKHQKNNFNNISNIKVNKIMNESIEKVNPNEKERKILNEFYDMVAGMVLTMSDYYIIVNNINKLLGND